MSKFFLTRGWQARAFSHAAKRYMWCIPEKAGTSHRQPFPVVERIVFYALRRRLFCGLNPVRKTERDCYCGGSTRKSVRLIPGCRLKVYEGAAHGLSITHAEQLNATCLHLRRVDKRQSSLLTAGTCAISPRMPIIY